MKINDVEREERINKHSWSNCLEIVSFKSLITLSEALQGVLGEVGEVGEEEGVFIKQIQAIKFQLYFSRNLDFPLKQLNLQNYMRSVTVYWRLLFITDHISRWPKK